MPQDKAVNTEPVGVKGEVPTVVLDDGLLRLRELIVDGAAVSAARDAVERGRDLEATVRQMLEVGGSVLLHGAALGTVDAVSAEVDRLLSALEEKSARIEAVRRLQERVAAKGLLYEELIAPVLDACFAPYHDVVEATGAVKGIADDKVGDFVVTLNTRDTGGRERRIVFECKDRKLPMDRTLEELDRAMLNRNAQVGVMVFASSEQAPLTGRPLRAFPGSRLMLVWDSEEQDALALEVGCQLARSFALQAERDDLDIDRALLAERVAKLISTIERASAVQRGIRSARRGLDAAEQSYLDMREEALAVLFELEDRLGEPSDEG
jgi:hypothetical protein